jgi:hypothetical protein
MRRPHASRPRSAHSTADTQSTATCTAAGRRRPLREDGAQRHRVRPHGRLRRRPQHLAPRRTPARRTRRRCRDRTAARRRVLPATTSTSRASPSCGGAAASSRRGCSISRCRARRRPSARQLLGTGFGLGRRPLDGMAAIDEGVPAPVLSSACSHASHRRATRISPARSSPPCARVFGGHEERSNP